MTTSPFISGPALLYAKAKDYSGPIRVEAVVTCAYCREQHGGECLGDLTGDRSVCPLVPLKAEIDRRDMERK